MDQQLPTNLTVCSESFALDGGTTHVSATDEAGKEHWVMLIQHAFVRPDAPPQALPGRLYFNGDLITVRSETEVGLLELLRNASVRVMNAEWPATGHRLSPNDLIIGEDIKRVVQGSPEQNLLAMLQGIIDYVASVEYVSFAAIFEEIRDKSSNE